MEMKSFLRANLDRVIAVALALVGLLAIIIGWFGVSGTGLAAEQLPYVISGGIGGIALIALGCTAWLSADLQDEWRRLDAIEERLEAIDPTPAASDAPEAEASSANGEASARRTRAGAPVPSNAKS